MRVTRTEALILRQEAVDASKADGGQDTLLVRVHTDEGITGIGEVDSSPEVAAAAILAPPSNTVVHGLASLLEGADPLDVDAAWERLYRGSIYMGRRGAVIHALSGIDMALWDIRGKALGRPVSALLGTPLHDSIRVYASVLMDERPEEVAHTVASLVARGFTAVKLGWGPLGRDPRHDVRLATAARDAAGGADLMLDAGCGYGTSVANALYVAGAAAELGYRWLEEPLHADDIDGYAEVTAKAPLPIAAGEQNATLWEFRALAQARAVNVIQPDLARCGGFTEALRIMRIAAKHNLWCVPHAWKSGILKAASLHWNAVLPGERLQEWCVADNILTSSLIAPALEVADGAAAVPTGPGLGVVVDDAIVARLLVT